MVEILFMEKYNFMLIIVEILIVLYVFILFGCKMYKYEFIYLFF